MSLAVERFGARPWADRDLESLFEGAFPAFITADQEAKAYIGRVREWFTELDIIVVEDGAAAVATGWAVPVRWDGSLAGLPAGYTDTLRRAVEAHETGERPDTLVICGGSAPLDPWLRTHWRLGGTIIATAPRSQTMTGTVPEWEAWTGMAFPGTGDYVIPRGLSILHIDTEADHGSYTEPNVWVRHR